VVDDVKWNEHVMRLRRRGGQRGREGELGGEGAIRSETQCAFLQWSGGTTLIDEITEDHWRVVQNIPVAVGRLSLDKYVLVFFKTTTLTNPNGLSHEDDVVFRNEVIGLFDL
jgi:hypothetical protein